MKIRHTCLVAGLLMVAALPVAAQRASVLATGKIESILVGESDTGSSISVVLTDNDSRKWTLDGTRNLNDAPGPGMLQLLLSARNTGARVSLHCATSCIPAVFDSISVE